MIRTPLILSVLGLSFLGLAAFTEVEGSPEVISGDSIILGGETVRLVGIDAPELPQQCEWPDKTIPCGILAKAALQDLVVGQTVHCVVADRDIYDRAIAMCTIGGADLSRNMVHTGWAIAYREFSNAYVAEEAEAKDAKRGMWKGSFTTPADWRRAQEWQEETAENDCRIKGNISRSGNRIYHVPGSDFYARTRISTESGERWFCSAEEAEAAGWRSPQPRSIKTPPRR